MPLAASQAATEVTNGRRMVTSTERVTTGMTNRKVLEWLSSDSCRVLLICVLYIGR